MLSFQYLKKNDVLDFFVSNYDFIGHSSCFELATSIKIHWLYTRTEKILFFC
jgi:hypothetical protein